MLDGITVQQVLPRCCNFSLMLCRYALCTLQMPMIQSNGWKKSFDRQNGAGELWWELASPGSKNETQHVRCRCRYVNSTQKMFLSCDADFLWRIKVQRGAFTDLVVQAQIQAARATPIARLFWNHIVRFNYTWSCKKQPTTIDHFMLDLDLDSDSDRDTCTVNLNSVLFLNWTTEL